LLLQEFNITIVDRPGKENLVADFLSQIPQVSNDIPVNDNFPDEHIFAVATKTPWFADKTNYLATGSCHLICHHHKREELSSRVLITLG